MKRNLKILLSAYACEPYKGSEPGVGWNWVKQAARFHDVWVLTRANNKESIDSVLQNENMPNVRWQYLDLPYWLRFWKSGRRGIHLYYYLWQIKAYFIAKKMHKKIRFDVVHHTTFVTHWKPSFLHWLPIPFIWGPVGGADKTPKNFLSMFPLKGKIFEYLRNWAIMFGEMDVNVRLAAKRSQFALAVTPRTMQRLKQSGAKKVDMLSQVGISPEELEKLSKIPFREEEPFRFVSVGSLLFWKGFLLSIEAFSRFTRQFGYSEFWIIGSGPERDYFKKRSKKLGINDKIKFLGSLGRQELWEKLGHCNILLHPSFHDSGAMVCAEAMAAGLPVICLDIGGPALQVTNETGFKIPLRSPDQVIEDVTKAMLLLAKNRDLRKEMSESSRQRIIDCFTWTAKGNFINEIYLNIAGTHE